MSTRRRTLTLVGASIVTFLVALDLLAITTALDEIRRDLDVSASALPWTVTGYSVAFASLLLLGSFENWGRFLPEQTTATAMLDRLLHHANVVTTDGASFRMREAKARTTSRRKTEPITPRGGYGVAGRSRLARISAAGSRAW